MIGARRRVVAGLGSALALVVVVSGCASKKQSVTGSGALLTAEGTYAYGMKRLADHDLRQAITTLQRIEYTPESLQVIEPQARLALADATFYQGTGIALIDARNLYLDFVTLYGDHALAPYAQMQAGQCSLKQVNHPSKDQSQTHQAIMDLQEVVRRFPNSFYTDAAQGLLTRARSNLAEQEYIVGKFYLKKKNYAAASRRFRNVLEDFPDYPEEDKVLFHLARALQGGNQEVESRIYLDQLLAEYPTGEYAAPARKLLMQVGGPLHDDGVTDSASN